MDGGQPSGASGPSGADANTTATGYAPGVTPAMIAKAKAKERELRSQLEKMFAEKSVPCDEGWRVDVKIRLTASSTATYDAYYFSPAGKRYRSRQEIARDFGLSDDAVPNPSAGKPRGRGKSEAASSAAAVAHTPLSRAEAVAAAQRRREAFALPRKLACGVTVTALGMLHPEDPHFSTADQLWPAGYMAEWEDEKGVRFVGSITESPSGPMFRIKAQRLPHDGRPATEVVELGAGPSPDAAYKDAEERQSEALEIALLNRSHRHRGHDADDSGASPPPPAGRALDAAEHLLVKCRPLGSQWGTERFGLADPEVLQAIEGLAGADRVPHYRFVDERAGGWLAVARHLNQQLAAHGKKQLPIDVRRLSGASEPSPAPRKRGPRPSRKEAEENAVRRLLDQCVRAVEQDEARATTAEQKARARAEKQAEKERKRAEREKMSEADKLARLQLKAAYIEAQRRAAEANATVEDTELPNASEPPPEPSRVAGGRLPLDQQAVLLEAWQFVARFGEQLLGLQAGEQLPTLQELESALLGELPAPPPPPAEAMEGVEGVEAAEPPQAPPSAAVRLQCALLDFLVGGLFNETAAAITGANSDISLADLRGQARAAAAKNAHPLAVSPDTWQELARRYLAVLATAAMTQAKDNSGAAGATSPLLVMDPWTVLQYLAAGPPPSLTQGVATLPRGASKTAGHCLTARSDAAAQAAAEASFAVVSGAAERGEEEVRAEQQLLRCLLKEIIQASKLKKGDGRVLCYGGQAAAAAAKVGRPLDLRGIAARIDAGVYSAMPQPLAAFAADVRYAASLLQAGCNRAASLFAQEYLERTAPELAALAVSKLDSALRELEVTGAADYVAHHAPPPRPRGRRQSEAPEAPAAVRAEGEGASEAPGASGREASAEPGAEASASAAAAESAQAQRQLTDAVRDLDRPFAPFKEMGSWQGCVVCWCDDDPARLLPCDACDCKHHAYCLEPPLEELPLAAEPFLCPRCRTLQGPGARSGGKPLSVEFARSSGGAEAWRLAQLLSERDYSEWSVDDRCRLLRLLCSLSAESTLLHNALCGEEDELREKRKEIASHRQEIKRIQQEQAAAEQAARAAAAAAAGEGGQEGAQPPAGGPQQQGAQSPPGLPPVPRQSARRGGRDPAARLEELVTRISQLEAGMVQVGPVRLDPVGLDRHYNRYWALPAAACAPDPAHLHPDAPPLLVIERQRPESLAPPGTEALAAAAEGGSGGAGGGWQVGVYRSILQLQQLAQWLNSKGSRERPLAEYVARLLDAHQQHAMLPQLARGPAPDPPRPADPPALRAASVQRLQAAMLAFEEGFGAGTYDDLAGSEERRHRWRQWVAAAATPQSLLSALLVLERMIRPEFLKPQWRPFAQPAPHPDDAVTLPAIWLRLEALKAGVRVKVALGVSIRAALGAGGSSALGGGSGMKGYSLRETRLAGGKRSYYEGPPSRHDSGDEGSQGDPQETRAERAAKRAKAREDGGAGADGDAPAADDEALARELDAQLNAGARRTRGGHVYAGQAGGGGEGSEEAEWQDDGEDEEEDQDDPMADASG